MNLYNTMLEASETESNVKGNVHVISGMSFKRIWKLEERLLLIVDCQHTEIGLQVLG